jgi:hypothetical protein
MARHNFRDLTREVHGCNISPTAVIPNSFHQAGKGRAASFFYFFPSLLLLAFYVYDNDADDQKEEPLSGCVQQMGSSPTVPAWSLEPELQEK